MFGLFLCMLIVICEFLVLVLKFFFFGNFNIFNFLLILVVVMFLGCLLIYLLIMLEVSVVCIVEKLFIVCCLLIFGI